MKLIDLLKFETYYIKRKRNIFEPKSESVSQNVDLSNQFYNTKNLSKFYTDWVYTCVSKIAESISSYEFKLYTVKRNGKDIKKSISTHVKDRFNKNGIYKDGNDKYEKIEVFDHPFLELFNSPNPINTRMALIQTFFIRLELNGVSTLYLPKGILNQPYQVWCFPLTNSGSIRPVVKGNNIEYYEYMDGTTNMKILPEELIYVNYPSPENPFKGMSPISSQSYPYDIDLFLSKHIYSTFKNGASFGNNFTTDEKLTDVQVTKLKDSIREQYASSVNAGLPIFTHSGLRLENNVLKSPLNNLEIEKITSYARDKIISSYKLTPGKLGLVKDVNRATMDVLDTMYYEDCIKPKSRFFQEFVQRYITNTYKESLIFEIDVPSVHDEEFELKEREVNLRIGYTTINEERNKEGKTSVPWGDMPFQILSNPLNQLDTSNVNVNESKNFEIKSIEKKPITFIFTSQNKALLDKYSQLFENMMKAFFKKMYVTVENKLLDTPGKSIVNSISGFSINKRSKWLKDHVKQIDDINIDDEEFTKELQNIAKEMFTFILQNIGSVKLNLLGVNGKYSVNNKEAEKWLGDRLRKFSTQVIGTTFDDITSVLREGFKEGQSIFEISNTLKEKFASYEKYRASLIAITETNAAISFSELDSIEQSGLDKKLKKFWIDSKDSAERDSHIVAGKRYDENGAIPIDENFVIGNDFMQGPSLGSIAAENINCRCQLGYVEITDN